MEASPLLWGRRGLFIPPPPNPTIMTRLFHGSKVSGNPRSFKPSSEQVLGLTKGLQLGCTLYGCSESCLDLTESTGPQNFWAKFREGYVIYRRFAEDHKLFELLGRWPNHALE